MTKYYLIDKNNEVIEEYDDRDIATKEYYKRRSAGEEITITWDVGLK